MQEYFSEAIKEAGSYPEMEQHKTLDCGHGRIEKRTYYLAGIRIWPNGRAFGGLEWYARKWNGMGKFVRIPDISFLPCLTCLHLQTQSGRIGGLKTPFIGV